VALNPKTDEAQWIYSHVNLPSEPFRISPTQEILLLALTYRHESSL